MFVLFFYIRVNFVTEPNLLNTKYTLPVGEIIKGHSY